MLPRQQVRRRIAIVNEWFEQAGGAERVLVSIRDALPSSETFVLWSDRDLADYPQMRESWLARTPLRGHKALTLPLMPLVWRTQTRSRFDVVLSLSHSINHTARLRLNPGGVHLSYVHTPARYVWTPRIDPRRTGPGQQLAIGALKRIESRTSRHVTSYAANSHAVRRRILRFWNREARVIHPPCRTSFFAAAPPEQRRQPRDYLIGFGRWVEYKRFDFILEVARRSRLPLVLAGGGPEEARLRAAAASTGVEVRFEMRPSDERLRELFWGARALIYPGHEDFGIVPVEAQACGTPVIGLNRGGLLDTVTDGVSGHLLDTLDVDRFAERALAAHQLAPEVVQLTVQRFSEEEFNRNIRSWVEEIADSCLPSGGVADE